MTIMMRNTLSILFLFSINIHRTIKYVCGQSDRIKLSTPEDVGLGHTQIIHNLQESFKRNTPDDYIEYLHAIYLEMRDSMCDSGEIDCHMRIAKKTSDPLISKRRKEANSYQQVKAILPDDFDGEVMKSLEKLLTLEAKLGKTDEAIRIMDKSMSDLKCSEVVENEIHRDIGLIAYSVGMESAKQWAEILKDPSDPFNNMLQKEDLVTRRLQFDVSLDDMNTTELFDQFSVVLRGDVVGAVDGALEGLLDLASNQTTISYALETATTESLKTFTTEVFGIDMEGGGACIIPGLPWCNDDGGISIGIGGNNTDGDPVFCDITPWLPVCQNNDDDDEGGDDDYCPFPSLPDCGLSFDDEGGLSYNEDEGPLCDRFPNMPQCADEGGESGGIGGVIGGVDGEDIVGVNPICITFPNLPMCGGSNPSDGNDATTETSENEDTSDGNDATTETSENEDTSDGNPADEEPSDGNGSGEDLSNGDVGNEVTSEDNNPISGNLCLLFPDLEACGGTGGNSGSSSENDEKPNTNNDEVGLLAEDNSVDEETNSPDSNGEEDCPFPALPNCGVMPEENPLCDMFPNSPGCGDTEGAGPTVGETSTNEVTENEETSSGSENVADVDSSSPGDNNIVSDSTEDCPYPSLPNCGVVPEQNPICAMFPNAPVCK